MNRRAVRLAASAHLFARSAFSRPSLWIALAAILAVAALSGPRLYAESAASLFKRGQAAEAREDYDTAVDFYQKAMAKDPKDLTYSSSLYRVRVSASAVHMSKGRRLLAAGDEQGALTEFLHATEIDPANEAPQQEIAKIRQRHGEMTQSAENSVPEAPGTQAELDSIGSPVELKPISNEPLTLHMTGDSKTVYQAVGKAAGVNVLFDPEFNSKPIQVDLTNMSLLDALRVVGTMSNTFWHPVTTNTIFVAANTAAKRRELDEQAVQTFYLSNAWQQNDVNDVQTALRNVLAGQVKIYAVPSQNAIVVRATPDELLLAQKLVNDLDKARPEVVVDISVLEVSKNWERTLGIAWPQTIGLALQAPNSSSTSTSSTSTTTGTSSTSTSPSLYDLSHLKASDFAVTIGGATANLLLTDANTKLLQNPRIRATDGQKATMKIGEKIPIATGSYGGGGLGGVGGVGGIGIGVQTQFQYQDVGVNIEMTPTVHYDNDITLKLKIDVTADTGSVTITGVTEPILSERVVDQVIRLREGEASILGGIQESQNQVSWSGIPGLSSIPILRYLFGSKDHTITDDELVFVVVPHVVRQQSLDQVNLRTVDVGNGANIDLRHVPAQQPSQPTNPNSNPTSNPAIAPASNPPVTQAPAVPRQPVSHPDFGVVPGQSANGAAPAALKQLSDSMDALGQTATAAVKNPSPVAPNSMAPTPAAPPPTAPPPTAPPPSAGKPLAGTPVAPAQVAPNPMPPGAAAPDPTGAQGLRFAFNPPPGPVAVGATFQVPVVLSGGTDIASVPLQIHYDPAKLSLVNVGPGEFLGRDAALVHRDDGSGGLSISAARPPGVPGVNGSGIVCVLSFQAKAAGESVLNITRSAVANSAQKPIPAQGAQLNIVVK
jgi:general secretion pathway protein D